METRHMVRNIASGTLAGVLLMLLLGEYVIGTDRKVWGLTLLAIGIYAQIAIAQATMWRLKTLRDIYTMGYRHGRHDANKSLLEAGLWLSDEAEQDARRNIGE